MPTPNTIVSKDGNEEASKSKAINMEAYQAYYNTNESSLAAGQAIPPGTKGISNINNNSGENTNDGKYVDPKENYNQPGL